MATAPMLIGVFGLPGVMSAWGFAAVRTIMREVAGEHRVVESDSHETFASARAQAPGARILLLSQYPEPALLQTVLEGGAAPILFLESMMGAAAYLALTTGKPALEVVRAVSASAACLAPLREQPSVLALHRADLSGRCIDVLLAYLCCHFDLAPSPEQVTTITRHLGRGPDDPGVAPALEAAAERAILGYVSPEASELDHGTQALVNAVLSPLDALFDFRAMPPIVWPGETFQRGDESDRAADGRVELAGGARCLVYGPYLHMPAGEWTARITLSLGRDTRDQRFLLEVAAGEVVGRVRIAPAAPGRYAALVSFAISAPLTPVEIRVFMENGAIEGSLALEDVQFTPRDELAATG